jgi:hypothetical protein
MRLPFSILTVLLVGFEVAPGPAQSTSSNDMPSAEVTGEVNLLQGKSGHPADASRVVVWLTPLEPLQKSHSFDKGHYRLIQRNKHFEPSLLVVPVGSVVDFPNFDPWFHNVFSFSIAASASTLASTRLAPNVRSNSIVPVPPFYSAISTRK